MMSVDNFLDKISMTQFEKNAASLIKCDCWGHNVLWYKHVLNIDISSLRGEHPSNIGGLRDGYLEFKNNWVRHDDPEDHDLVLLRVGRVIPGHTGIYYNGYISHVAEDVGYQCVPVGKIEGRIHGFYGRK